MTTTDLAGLEGFSSAVDAGSKPIEKVYCGDLLSWVMSRAPENCAWCTIMGNVNSVAVASLADVAAIVLCENAVLDEEAAKKAEEKGINIVKTAMPAFDAGLKIYHEI